MNCIFSDTCKRENEPPCRVACYPYSRMLTVWKYMNVPKKYSNLFFKHLPIESDNPKPYMLIEKYIGDFDIYVKKRGIGLFLHSIPSDKNVLGTGTGKTTSAIIVANEYAKHRLSQHLKKERPLEGQPVYFIELADFQNKYNEQFRGTPELQQEASLRYYSFKDKMKNVELLVIDDIGTRLGLTDAFVNECYEIINERVTQERPVIYTSNIPLENLVDVFGHRITSRIEGSTVKVGFRGIDHRRKGLR